MYHSESEAPFDAFRWKASGSDLLKDVQAHAKKGATAIEQPVEGFFGQLQDRDDAPRFAQVRKALESVAAGVRVFRAGRGEVDVFLVARSRTGDWVGVHTTSVET